MAAKGQKISASARNRKKADHLFRQCLEEAHGIMGDLLHERDELTCRNVLKSDVVHWQDRLALLREFRQ